MIAERVMQTEVQLNINGVDVSADINKYFLGLTYTDHEEDNADDLQLELDDVGGVWIGNWMESAENAKISATIAPQGSHALPCGEFEIDSLDASGPPSTVSLKATALPFVATLRTATNTKAWENLNLSAIASEIASKNNMAAMCESTFDPFYDRKEQRDISDIVFLQELCRNAGISLKVSGGNIVLFDASVYEQKSSIMTLKKGESNIKSYRFGKSKNDTYSSCRVAYTDPQSEQTIEYIFTPPGYAPDGQVLNINERVTSRDEAREVAKRRLRGKNKQQPRAEFKLAGDVRLVSGVTVDVAGFGVFDGKYIVQRAKHAVKKNSGYTTNLQLRRVLEGY